VTLVQVAHLSALDDVKIDSLADGGTVSRITLVLRHGAELADPETGVWLYSDYQRLSWERTSSALAGIRNSVGHGGRPNPPAWHGAIPTGDDQVE